MEFRYPTAVAQTNAKSLQYLTEGMSDPEDGQETFEQLLIELGNTVDYYPDWHPILTLPPYEGQMRATVQSIEAYQGVDHTVYFIRGFVTCPYDESKADRLVSSINRIMGLSAYRLDSALYNDHAYPVVVEAINVELEADGTIRGRDVLTWCVKDLVKKAETYEVAETWWTLRSYLLGSPHGARSSTFVNQHTGGHIRKILESMNESGMFGPIKEWSLDMFSKKKKETISNTLIMAAINIYKEEKEPQFQFELRGETCKAKVRDTSGGDTEFFVEVEIGENGESDLLIRGFYKANKANKDNLAALDPKGKRLLAEKFA